MRWVWVLIGIVLLVVTFIAKRPSASQEEIYAVDKKYEASAPEVYKEDCEADAKNSLKFPVREASYAVICDDGWVWQKQEKIDGQVLDMMLMILNDSSSYRWGELGTPHFDRSVYFYDKKDEIVGFTKLSYEGQTYSYPYTRCMKYGMLNNDAQVAMIRLTNMK